MNDKVHCHKLTLHTRKNLAYRYRFDRFLKLKFIINFMFYVSFRPVVLAHSHNLLSLFCTSSCGSSSSKLEHKYCNCANLTRTNQIKLSLPLFKKTIIQWAQVEISRRCMSSVDKYSINTNRHESSRRVSVCHIAARSMMMVSM